MDRKIVFFDLDGTILDDDKKIPSSTKEAVFRLQKNGVYTALATGRGPRDMEWVAKELNMDSYVAINGSYAKLAGRQVFFHAINKNEVVNLVETVNKYNHSAAFITYDDVWALDEDHPSIIECTKALNIQYPRVDKNLHIKKPISQTVVYCTEEYDELFKKTHPNLQFTRFHKVGMDATDKRINKAVGISEILKAGGFKRENTYAFGDELNDLAMVSYVGCGIAMGNAIPKLKEAADYVTTSNMEDGIWKACKELGLFEAK